MNAEEYHLIEKYLNNDLTEDEQNDFDSRMEDEQFAKKVRVYKEVSESLKAQEKSKHGEEDLKLTLEAVSSEFFASSKKNGRTIPLRNIYWAAAACIVLALSFVFIISWPSGPNYNDYSDYEPLTLSSRSENQSLTMAAEEAFNGKKYTEAAKLLNQLLKADPENPRLKVYLAISYIEIDNYTAAENLLTDVAQGKSVFQSAASWYLALGYLRQDKTNACKKQLEQIPETSPYFNRSKELLDKL
ncbi:tetratricopeptide repeat protein [Fulvivirga sp. 29W222]|uniref:Tetratricopeptide repeat protein n=1 Tax=Fulvivirga marina TaxID=2494733 RepID=A0A937FXX7_9BACT|nr:tetratricopeptide repeat protein [Fulvivirga marina]MBL6447037.1 tetratricopeptide repeat protein [Fulvivirga marina]